MRRVTGHRQACVRHGVARLQLDKMSELPARFLEAFLLEQPWSQRLNQSGIFGLESQCPFQFCQGRFRVAGLLEEIRLFQKFIRGCCFHIGIRFDGCRRVFAQGAFSDAQVVFCQFIFRIIIPKIKFQKDVFKFFYWFFYLLLFILIRYREHFNLMIVIFWVRSGWQTWKVLIRILIYVHFKIGLFCCGPLPLTIISILKTLLDFI